jgi:hypothetical protein
MPLTRLLVGAAVATLASASIAGAAVNFGAPNQPFIVFDGLLYKGKPDLAALGMAPIAGVNSPAASNPTPHVVEDEAVRTTLKTWRDFTGVVYLDYELWPTSQEPAADVSKSIEMMTRVLGIAHEAVPNAKFGYYGILPCRDYWTVIGNDQGKIRAWQACNARLDQLAEHVDVIFPSLYTFYNDQAGWDRFAAAELEAALRYHKPVYAFLWPEFHVSNALLKGTNIPASFWRHELEFCRTHADGIVIWGGWQEPWDERAAWWQETKAFLAGLNTR